MKCRILATRDLEDLGENVLKLGDSHLQVTSCVPGVCKGGRACSSSDRQVLTVEWSAPPSRLSEFDVRRPCIQPTNPPGAKSDYGICSLFI